MMGWLRRHGFRRPSEVLLLRRMALRQVATGISSNNLALHVLDVRPLVEHEKPIDASDFARCMALYHASPKHLQRKMRPILDAWARDVRMYWRRRIEENEARGYRVSAWMAAQLETAPNYNPQKNNRKQAPCTR